MIEIADNADMIVNGYAFTESQGRVRVLNLNGAGGAAVYEFPLKGAGLLPHGACRVGKTAEKAAEKKKAAEKSGGKRRARRWRTRRTGGLWLS